jgi:AraC-like DNA-binding protein
MDYAEHCLPPALDGLVAAVWTAHVPENGAEWIEQEAAPDGCIELIRRDSGRSVWRREQPALFATGLATVTAKLRLGAGARFTGIKLWPWAWHALGGAPCPGFADAWVAIDNPRLAALIEGSPAEIAARLVEAFAGTDGAFGRAILAGRTVAEIAARAGLSHRQLQRRFERELGMPPRVYLRLVRFRGAMYAVQAGAAPLADTAAARGYVDQAHMAREFRELAGMAPSKARTRAKGPFV